MGPLLELVKKHRGLFGVCLGVMVGGLLVFGGVDYYYKTKLDKQTKIIKEQDQKIQESLETRGKALIKSETQTEVTKVEKKKFIIKTEGLKIDKKEVDQKIAVLEEQIVLAKRELEVTAVTLEDTQDKLKLALDTMGLQDQEITYLKGKVILAEDQNGACIAYVNVLEQDNATKQTVIDRDAVTIADLQQGLTDRDRKISTLESAKKWDSVKWKLGAAAGVVIGVVVHEAVRD